MAKPKVGRLRVAEIGGLRLSEDEFLCLRRRLTETYESEYNTAVGVVPKYSPAIPCRSQQLRLLAMKEVAQRLGISLQRAYEMGRLGLLPVVRLGRQLRVEEGRLASWIESGGRGLPGGWKRNSD